MFSADPSLPISLVLPAITSALLSDNELVLEAPPGAGKTTAVPLAFIDAPWRQRKKIIVLEPRRVAARAAAERMANLLGEKVGETVGYTIRLEKKTSSKTIIEVITEGVLTRRLQHDPELSDTALVIFDEFHERNIHSDLGLALCLQGRELFRDSHDPLKLLVMSATLDGDSVASLLGTSNIIRSQGRSYPVDCFYGTHLSLREPIHNAVCETIEIALKKQTGNILVFLPGQNEIRRCLTSLQSRLSNKDQASIALLALHGSIPLREQQAAIAPLPANSPFNRKVVFATDIAETSLTIEGVNIVVDAGLARKPQFDPRTGMTRLQTCRISRASSEQRAGRAGRLAPGVCYRLWSDVQHSQLVPHTPAEILIADLAPLALQLLQWGVTDPSDLKWLDTPGAATFAQAKQLLRTLGALTDTGNLNSHGEKMASLPTEPRLAHMLLMGAAHNALETACLIAALMGERNPINEVDIEHTLHVLTGDRNTNQQHHHWLIRTRKQAKQFQQSLRGKTTSDREKIATPLQMGFLLACAYPDRIAQKRDNSRHHYLLSNGRTAIIDSNSALAGSDWLAVAELGGHTGQSEDKIYSAASLDPALFSTALSALLTEKTVLEWQNDRLIAESQTCIGSIILNKQPLKNLSDNDKQQAVINLIRSHGINCLPWNNELRQWQARVMLLNSTLPNNDWPNVGDAHLLATLESWLAPYLSRITKRTDLKTLDLHSILENLLPWPKPKDLNNLAPTRLNVPSGSSLSLDYCQSPPVLEVKLQEMFGCTQTPALVNGKVKIQLHLLSPARRPLQITQDLEGFWQTSYQDVKKEMKGRYPKHPWPDNPLDAQATRYTKKKAKR
ncbi:ATP-dependent helicase HrpB [Teredinibacter purpureus]|uniref:ATP-dependent helicase HrpB n=1 Tax=Teredinibacter purpureus TaxID=2731756 RepID=UPI0005F8129F|nr:ATP-dependent helicase HrpB [Teredinibacter purpureus]